MNLYHLRYFATLAHLEHYTKAAEILSITQPSLSHAIASLEKELGVKLFEKEGRNVVTGRGEGRIDIVELRALSSTVVPGFVKGFLDSTPDKKIDFYFHSSTGLTSDMIQGLKDRKYDIAFCSMMDNEPLIEFIPVTKQELVLIVPKGHPLEERSSIDLKDTLSYPHIAFSKRSGLRYVIDKLFHKCGGYPQIAYSMEEDQGVAGLVGAGFGIAVVPKMPILSYMPVSIIEIEKPSWERLFYMATLKNVYQAPVIIDFKKYVIEHANL